jgi:prephenate dehydratase
MDEGTKDQEPGTKGPAPLAAYQGAPGAYSETAAWALLGPDAPLLPCVTLLDVFDAVASGRASRAVVPVENTLAGAVPDAAELIVAHDVTVTGETIVQIEHVLAAPLGLRLADVRRVLSHPVALAQCTRFFHDHPAIAAVPVFDTAGAVPLALAADDHATAAIASRRAAALHGAQILAEHFQDHAENWTRFLLVTPAANWVAPPAWPHKAMIACRLRHEPGALARALAPVAARGLNLTRIESRPIHGRPFEYQFLLELQADRAGQDLQPAIDDLAREASWLHVLGIFTPAPRLS